MTISAKRFDEIASIAGNDQDFDRLLREERVRLEERERCAKIAEHYHDNEPDQPGCCWKEIAQRIRKGE